MRHERAKIVKVLEAVETVQQLPSTVLKKLSGRDNLWEIKVGSHRLLGFFHRRDLLVLVHAFTKKTRKTPPQEESSTKSGVAVGSANDPANIL